MVFVIIYTVRSFVSALISSSRGIEHKLCLNFAGDAYCGSAVLVHIRSIKHDQYFYNCG